MLKIENLSVHYPGAQSEALSDLNATFNQGEFVCILGKSGAGKSTLLRCLNGLQRPTKGIVSIEGHSITQLTESELRKVRREIGMIFQHFNLIPRFTVLQNVLTGTFGYRSSFKNLIGWFSTEEIQVAKELLSDVELTKFSDRKVEQLSGGQKQRVGIARALAQNPKMILGDEPVASLDPGTSQHIFELLKKIHEERHLLTIINVHNLELAKRFATRLLALKNGRVIFDGVPSDFNEKEYNETYASQVSHDE